MVDVLLRGGWVIDGTGAPAFRADVAVEGERIAAVGRLASAGAGAATEIDATGRYVIPGLIDAHAHGDAAVLDPDVQLAALRQGVTTFVLGQDGLSYAPATAESLRYVTRYFAAVNGTHPGLDLDRPTTVAGLLATYDRTTALNTAYLVPHGTVRHSVLGASKAAPTAAELAAMVRLVEQGLDDGAVGFSSGLDYLPGKYAQAAELAALCGPAAARGLPYVTHMRGYDAKAGTAMDEVRQIARQSGVAAHVSHYHGPGTWLVELLEAARAEGLDVTFDHYPYLRGSSILAMVALPDWLEDADLDATVDALTRADVRRRLAAETDPDVWPRITLALVPVEEYRWAQGLTLPAAAERAGRPPAEFCADVLVATRLGASCVFGRPPSTDEASLSELVGHPAHTGGSDGIYTEGHAHPRGWGTFARILGRHVRELGDLTWEQAVVHLSAHPARRFGLTDRGLVRPGMAADLAVVDPATVGDRSDYATPRELATGVDDVLVGGTQVLAGGALTGARPGRPLRPR